MINLFLKVIFFLFYYTYQIILNIISLLILNVLMFFLFLFVDRAKISIIVTKSLKIVYPILFKIISLKLIFLDPHKLLNKTFAQPTMFIFNHTHALDPFMVGQALPNNNIWIAKDAIRNYYIIGPLLKYSNILMLVKKGKSFFKTIDNVLHQINLNKNKFSISAFPEGYIPKDKKIKPFKSGPFHIAIKQKMPICMIYIEDCTKGFNINPFLLNPGNMKYHVLGILETNNVLLKDINEIRMSAEKCYHLKQMELKK